MRLRTRALSLLEYDLRIGVVVISAQKSIPGCIESVDGSVYRPYCVMVAALSVFCLMINSRTDDLNFAGREVTLEVS